jgi:hypothetical protein
LNVELPDPTRAQFLVVRRDKIVHLYNLLRNAVGICST